MAIQEFSVATRAKAIHAFKNQTFDLLILGGGITGAASARDAAGRGLKVALIEAKDFAFGTSSRSSKLIHGGLRYLENFDFGLVFEALAERALLLKTASHLVRPLPFYFPVFEGDRNSMNKMSLGMWLYDMLAMFRTPGMHQRLSKQEFLNAFPGLNGEKLKGGFRYFDASMWDDRMVLDIARSACARGAHLANYIEAKGPLWTKVPGHPDRLTGFTVQDQSPFDNQGEFEIHAHQVLVAAGPWTDFVGKMIEPHWKPWLAPSRGLHLVFDSKRLPVDGALVMSHPVDGRISFVIPRPDFGPGVTMVGTTDGAAPKDPGSTDVFKEDVSYLLDLLNRYFSGHKLVTSDIQSATLGVRPLMNPGAGTSLQKVSREHYIGEGPGGSIFVAGGKYTTHRVMAEEIIDHVLMARPSSLPRLKLQSPDTEKAFFAEALIRNKTKNARLDALYGVVGAELERTSSSVADPEGFPFLESQFRFSHQCEMVVRLEDFWVRRLPLYLSLKDHGIPWVEPVSKIWSELGVRSESQRQAEILAVHTEIKKRDQFKTL